MINSSNKLVKFTQSCMKACKLSRIRLFSNKFSKKIYTQRQHVCILLLMKKLKMNYREVVELIEVTPDLRKIISLKHIPHYTTIHKFFKRFNSNIFTLLLVQTAKLFDLSGIIAIDSTGFSSNNASRYYSMIKYRQTGNVWKDSYIKNSAIVDTEKQCIIAVKCRNDHTHDNVDFISLMKRVNKDMKARIVIADRGYDSEENNKFIRKKMKAMNLIRIRMERNRKRLKGRLRRELAKDFDWKTYGKRNIIECVFFVIKRKFGDTMKSRSWRMQTKEMKLVCIAYNLYRYTVCLIFSVEDFYTTV